MSRVWLVAIAAIAVAVTVRWCQKLELYRGPRFLEQLPERLSRAETFEVWRVKSAVDSSDAVRVAGVPVAIVETRDVGAQQARGSLLLRVGSFGGLLPSDGELLLCRPSFALLVTDEVGSVELLFDEANNRIWWESGSDHGVASPQLPSAVRAVFEELLEH